MSQTDIKAKLAQTMRQVYERGLTTLSGGNLSVRDRTEVYITPSGVDKGLLKAEDIVRLSPDGNHHGQYRPSSEYPFHLAIYDVRSDVNVVLHAHSPALVAYCIAHKAPDTRIIADAFVRCGDIAYASYVMPGSMKLGAKLAESVATGANVVIMENHGVVALGKDLDEAYLRLELASFVAQTTIQAQWLGANLHHSANVFNATEIGNEILQTGMDESQSALQETIIRFAHRACQQKLMVGGMGFISAKVGDQYWVTNGNHWDLQAEDIVRMSEVPLHKYSDAPFMMLAHPPHLMAFACTHKHIETRTIPEAYVTLPQIPMVADDPEAIRVALENGAKAILIANRGVLVTDKTMTATFDNLEVLEYTARSAIQARALGGVVPMSEQAIHELNTEYGQYYQGLQTGD